MEEVGHAQWVFTVSKMLRVYFLHHRELLGALSLAACGEWIPLPYVDEGAAEKLFRHKVLALLRRRGRLSQERIEMLLSWRRSGFSVHNRVHVTETLRADPRFRALAQAIR